MEFQINLLQSWHFLFWNSATRIADAQFGGVLYGSKPNLDLPRQGVLIRIREQIQYNLKTTRKSDKAFFFFRLFFLSFLPFRFLSFHVPFIFVSVTFSHISAST